MIKKIIRGKKVMLSMVLICALSLIPASSVFAYTAEGSVGSISYVARAEADPLTAYLKNSTSKPMVHSGTMSGQKQAFLGMPCGHEFHVSIPAKSTTSSGKTYYVDAEAHSILEVSFSWYLNGTNIENHTIQPKPYR